MKSSYKKIIALPILGILVFAISLILLPAQEVGAVPNQLDGTIYWDENNNGTQDPGEPGVENVVVRFGTGDTTVTDANGDYVLPGVSGTSNLVLEAGWFRSDCDALSCAAGTPGGNDFEVSNQLIQLPGTDGDAGGTFNTGLVPDWGSNYPITSGSPGQPIDVGMRLSYIFNSCSQGTGAERLCAPGDTFTFTSTLFNQGTEDITNPIFSMEVPVGHTFNDGSWSDGAASHPDANTVTVIEPFDPATGRGIYQLNGTVPAGASALMFANITVEPNAIGTEPPYPASSQRDKQLIGRVLSMDQTGDSDSDFCLPPSLDWQYGTCALDPLGVHNKLLPTDHTDSMDWNIQATFEPRDDSVTTSAALIDPAGDVAVCEGQDPDPSTVTAQLTVTNTSTGDSPLRNFDLTVAVPSGLNFNPADNPGWFIGSDGQPHTFLGFQIMPGESSTVPIVLEVDPSVTEADNGTAALQINSSIEAYDTSIVVDIPGESAEFEEGSLSGTLAAQESVTVAEVEGCEAGALAPTGQNTLTYIGISATLILLSLVGLVRAHPITASR